MNLSNGLSLARGPLALCFLFESIPLRIIAIILAMFTDSIDGHIARRTNKTTRLGAVLDPTMDKFFVIFVLGVLLFEGRLLLWQACAMISRDFALCLFATYLASTGLWQAHRCKAVRWSKMTTALQFLVLIGLTLQITFPWYVYSCFVFSGLLALTELIGSNKETLTSK